MTDLPKQNWPEKDARMNLGSTLAAAALASAAPLSAADSPDPKDWSAWKTYRTHVQRPSTLIQAADLARARENGASYEWARNHVEAIRTTADRYVTTIDPDYVERMIEITTPGCTGPCPACRAKGLPWHPNGQWAWGSAKPDQLTCRACKTVFPHPDFPESIVLQSKWDPRQKFSFIGGDTFRCFGYRYARPSLSGIIRARKVGYMASVAASLATAYALTEDARYANTAKRILLRFAEVLPKYLVRAGYGYGEYADCDPHIAAEHIGKLPVDELVYPPNKPNRSIYAGYWAASRIGSSGMDGGWVSRMALTYDLTCTAADDDGPVFSTEERLLIERDLLLESSYLAACDRAINNKSVGNRAGAAMVGLAVGHPGLVRFGLEGFTRTVNEWFLPDGGTSESAAYALMTMSGIRPFGLAFRDYTDPEGFAVPDGERFVGFNACRDTRYGDCWQGLLWTLQGDLRHPPLADSYKTTRIGSGFAELIALAYPTEQHLAFLKESSGTAPRGSAAGQALFYREPGLERRRMPSFSLPDIVFPFLSQGYLRRGPDGRAGLAVLNASDWGGHHHRDSLDLYYWQDGRELLSDLGYLWDHPDKSKTSRTQAHNLVMIDGKEQATKGRRGDFQLFAITPRIKIMEASSRAYGQADDYRRTCIQIEHPDGGSYLVDIFRAGGGALREYLFHGPGTDWQASGLDLAPVNANTAEREIRFALRFHLPALGEIVVDDMELRELRADGTRGPNLVPVPGRLPAGAKPENWGRYVGNGKARWGMIDTGGTHGPAIRFQATQAQADGVVNVALIAGNSDGYRGRNALRGRPGAEYSIRFALRGTVENVRMGCVFWENDPGSPEDRRYAAVRITNRPLQAGPEWTIFEGHFSLPDANAGVREARQAPGANPWHITWKVDEDYRFTAWAPGYTGEKVRVGDGWGQRDHRNSDRGAVLPYIFRQRRGKGGADAFVSVFSGYPKDAGLVRGVTRLNTTEPDAVALAVETVHGMDVIVSKTTPGTITLRTPLGEITTDAAAAAILTVDRSAVAGALTGGSFLAGPGLEVSVPRAVLRGAVLGTNSTRGESYFLLDLEIADSAPLIGVTGFLADDDGRRRAFPIRAAKGTPQGLRLYTKHAGAGFEAIGRGTFEIPSVASWERK